MAKVPEQKLFVGTLAAAGVGCWVCAATFAADPLQAVLHSVDRGARIELSCAPRKSIEVMVSGHRDGPLIQTPDHSAGAGKKGSVQYTFDGQGPFLEDWLLRDDGFTPRTREQLAAFVTGIGSGHVLFLGMHGMRPFEFQLDEYAGQLRAFASACRHKP
ncbi:MAG: hypothetical protein ACT4N4_06440 [Rhodospirillales bacterium]